MDAMTCGCTIICAQCGVSVQGGACVVGDLNAFDHNLTLQNDAGSCGMRDSHSTLKHAKQQDQSGRGLLRVLKIDDRADKTRPWLQPGGDPAERARQLVVTMTVDEKIGQQSTDHPGAPRSDRAARCT